MSTKQRVRRGPSARNDKQVYCVVFSSDIDILQKHVPDENFKVLTFNMLQKTNGKHSMYDAARSGARHVRSWIISTKHTELPQNNMDMNFSIRRMKYTEPETELDDEDIDREELEPESYVLNLEGEFIKVMSGIETKNIRNPSWVPVGRTSKSTPFQDKCVSVRWMYDKGNIFRPTKVSKSNRVVENIDTATPTNTDVGLLMHAFDQNEVYTDL